jgi:hypothetical protein
MFENTFVGPKRGFPKACALVCSTTDPGDTGRGAGLFGTGFEVWQQLGNQEGVGAVIYLDDPIVTAGAAFELEISDTGVEDKDVDNGDFVTELLGKSLDAIVFVDVQFHDFDCGIGVFGLDTRITP